MKIILPGGNGQVGHLLGPHRLLCGNATERPDFALLMAAEQAAMVFTDPPYNVDYRGGGNQPVRTMANDNLGDTFAIFLRQKKTLI